MFYTSANRDSIMIYVFSAFLFGVSVSCLLILRENANLKFDKEMLLEFNEKQIRLIEELEAYETQLSLRLFYLEHPELKEDQILEAEFVE